MIAFEKKPSIECGSISQSMTRHLRWFVKRFAGVVQTSLALAFRPPLNPLHVPAMPSVIMFKQNGQAVASVRPPLDERRETDRALALTARLPFP